MARPKDTKKFLTEKQLKDVERLAGLGLKVTDIAAIVGVSKATFERRYKDQPEVFEALSKGRADSANAVTQTAYQMAVSGEHPNMTIFWLKTRLRWREAKEEVIEFDLED